MAASVIPILLDSSEESMGSHVSRVILFGAIPAIFPVIPKVHTDPLVALEVGAVSVISLAEVLDLVDYSSSSGSNPLKDSLPPAPNLPLVSPLFCYDDSKVDSESEPAEHRHKRHESLAVHDAMVSRWMDRVASRPSSPSGSSPHDTFAPSSEFSFAPIVASPEIHLHGDMYLNVYRIVILHQISLQTHLLMVHLWILHQILLLVHLQIHFQTHNHFILKDAMHQAFRRWGSAPLSTPYQPKTSESSLDSSYERSLNSSSLSAGPSRKRCRSPTILVPSSTPVSRSIALTHADLLPPRKRFRHSYSPEDSREEHIEICTADAEAVVDLGISDEVEVDTKDRIGLGVEIAVSDIKEDEEEFEVEASAGGTMEIAVDPLVTGGIFESTRGDAHDLEGTILDILEAGQLMGSEERAGLIDRIRRLGRENLRMRALFCIERDRVDSLRHHMVLSQEKFCQIRRDHDNAQRRLMRLESFVERSLGFCP
uniref:Uncharacterized protein n=1 Tax=Tanacetum cinerariifolium TaxID=118510 RepID=A0A699HGG7_TANCI|nr:hypothetical protein [Tanacetum cinerariifolium]